LRHWRHWRRKVHRVNTILSMLAVATAMSIAFFGLATYVTPAQDAKKVIELESPAVALTAADSTVFAASASGTITAIDDSVTAHTKGSVDVGHPVVALAVYGSDVYALGGDVITRLTLALKIVRSRALAGENPTRMGSGTCGIWLAGGPSGTVECMNPQTLDTVWRAHVTSHVGALLVTRQAVWLTDALTGRLIEIGRRKRGFALLRAIPAPRGPTALADLEGSILVLSTAEHRMLLYDAASGLPRHSYLRVPPGSTTVTNGDGAAWVGSERNESVSQYGLHSHRRIGKPIDVASAPVSLVVDLVAVWSAAADKDEVVRLDLRGLAVEHQANAGAWDSALGLSSADWLLAACMFGGLWLMARRVWASSNPDEGVPQYESRPITLLAYHPRWWTSLIEGVVTRADRTRGRWLSFVFHGLGVGGGSEEQLRIDSPPPEHTVRRELRVLDRRQLIVYCLSYVPAIRRRLRLRRGTTPRSSSLKRRIAELGPSQLVMLVGRWSVRVIGHDAEAIIHMELLTAMDSFRGGWKQIDVPPDARIVIEFPRAMLVDADDGLLDANEHQLDVLAVVPHRGRQASPLELTMVLVFVRINRPGAP
jgi:hypothetical protein